MTRIEEHITKEQRLMKGLKKGNQSLSRLSKLSWLILVIFACLPWSVKTALNLEI